ncbi:MAG: thiol-disulfide oxidoreductase DCC family protein [Cyclobacteriaceae bacterium]
MEYKVIFFDGVCNLCNSSINFIIDRDKNTVFRYAPLQSDYARELLEPLGVDTDKLESILLYDDGKVYSKSSAALKISKHLSGGWSFLSVFLIIPKFIRDVIYDIIARNRYKWFGKKNECRIPTPELKSLFVG